MNLVGDRNISTGSDGALVPHDRLVNPIVVTPRIGVGFLTAGRGLRYALVARIHSVTG